MKGEAITSTGVEHTSSRHTAAISTQLASISIKGSAQLYLQFKKIPGAEARTRTWLTGGRCSRPSGDQVRLQYNIESYIQDTVLRTPQRSTTVRVQYQPGIQRHEVEN